MSSPLHDPMARRRVFLWLLPAYLALALAGALTHRQSFSVAAIALLLALLLWPALSRGRPWAWLLWPALIGGMAWLALHALAELALETVPILVSALIAWLFGRTLRAGRQPLIARVIEAVEGAPRLAMPGVARYARQLTWCWAVLLGAQAAVLLLLLACAVPGGLLLALDITPPLALPARWALGYVQVGGYALLVIAFAAEYVFRRWHLRHLPHLGPRELLLRTAARWPQLVRREQVHAMSHPSSYRAPVCIAAGHPSLPGHFPGAPLVPGVVLLEQVAIGLRAWRNQRLARVVEAKFLAPLLPGEPAELLLENHGERVRFEISRNGTLLARGTVSTDASEAET